MSFTAVIACLGRQCCNLNAIKTAFLQINHPRLLPLRRDIPETAVDRGDANHQAPAPNHDPGTPMLAQIFPSFWNFCDPPSIIPGPHIPVFTSST